MASTPHLDVEPWLVREPAVSVEALPVTESVLSLSNGYLGIRGTLDEVEPHQARGTFLSGVHETHPLSYPEGGYGHPAEGQAMIAVADATPLRLVVDGAPLDIRTIDPEAHHRTLDMRTGILERVLVWRSLAGARLELRSERLVSLRERSLTAIRYRVRVLDGAAHVVVRSQLVLGASPPEVDSDDPRVAEALDHPFEQLELSHGDDGGALSAVTRRTGMRVAAAVRHVVEGADDMSTHAAADDHVVTTITAALTTGRSLEVVKTFGHVWSKDASAASELEAARAVVDSGVDEGWDGLVAAQRTELGELWAVADVEVEGDDELQQALRFSLFTLLTGTACVSGGAPVGAKGLTGLGYNGHTFWDIEGFVVPALSLLVPDAAARLLAWRAATLDAARDRARVLGLQGATFAWRTIDGHETSAYWPASTAAMHVNADISRAFWLHGHVTGTGPVPLGGLAVLVETARLWISLGHHDIDGGWHLFGMTGPDEYTGVVDDNVFTNLMARRNLVRAAEVCEQLPQEAEALGVTTAETTRWRSAAQAVHVPWDERRQVHPANTGFTFYEEWDFDADGQYPVQEHHHYSTIYRHQILKQADTELALWWCREDFTDSEIARDVDYYEARTVRDSSLSASAQAVACAKAQHPDLAYRYLRECALVDLRDLQNDTEQGLHLASVGGTWLALTAGLGGLREDHDDLELAPLLPARLSRTRYRVTWRGRLLQVESTRAGTTVTMLRGEEPVGVVIDGERVEVAPGSPASAPLREPTPLLPEPTQPTGRAPQA